MINRTAPSESPLSYLLIAPTIIWIFKKLSRCFLANTQYFLLFSDFLRSRLTNRILKSLLRPCSSEEVDFYCVSKPVKGVKNVLMKGENSTSHATTHSCRRGKKQGGMRKSFRLFFNSTPLLFHGGFDESQNRMSVACGLRGSSSSTFM